MTAPAATATEDRALALLGSGVPAENVAAALGVSASRISQLLSDENFAGQVAELRYDNLQSHNLRDGKYDEMEDTLLDKLKGSVPLMFRPVDILKAIQVINGAKRRGQSAPEQVTNQQTVVQLVLPTQVVQQFTTNINNQVITAGGQDLNTMQASKLLELTEDTPAEKEETSNEQKVLAAEGS